MHTFVYSSTNPPTDDFFYGYAYIDAHIVLGQSGANEYAHHENKRIAPGEDGCYVSGTRLDGKFVIGTDFIGASRLFYYSGTGYWALSNSFYELVRHLKEHLLTRNATPQLTPQHHLLEAFSIKGPFGNQLQSFATTLYPIRLLPADQVIEITADGLHPAPLPQHRDEDYASALHAYLNTCCSRIWTAINCGLNVSADLSGGLDSRTTLAMVLRVRQELSDDKSASIVFTSSNEPRLSQDYAIASDIARRVGFPLNATRTSQALSRRTEAERFHMWKNVALGTTNVVRLPAKKFDQKQIRIGGGGGECVRPFYPAPDMQSMLKRCKKYFSDNTMHSMWARSVSEDVGGLTRRSRPAGISPLITHYRHFRARFHTGTTSHYTRMLLPLQSKFFIDACSATSALNLECRQPFYDIMASCHGDLLDLPFDEKKKTPSSTNIKNLTIVDVEISKYGRVYGINSLNTVNENGHDNSNQTPISDYFEKALENSLAVSSPALLTRFSSSNAFSYLGELRNAHSTARPKEGADLHNIILTGLLCGADI